MLNKIPSPKDINYYNIVLTQPDNVSKCNSKNCDNILGLYPKYCFIHTLKKYNLYISKSCIQDVGMGLFSGPNGFKKGDVIGKYSSEQNQITYGELLEKNKNYTDINERTKYILCNIPKKNQNQEDVMCWDGLDIRSTILRFINDSYNTKFKNNTYFTIQNDEAYVVALENIKPFHELYISYGTKYWD